MSQWNKKNPKIIIYELLKGLRLSLRVKERIQRLEKGYLQSKTKTNNNKFVEARGYEDFFPVTWRHIVLWTSKRFWPFSKQILEDAFYHQQTSPWRWARWILSPCWDEETAPQIGQFVQESHRQSIWCPSWKPPIPCSFWRCTTFII